MNLWTVARQAPRLMGFSRQEYWSGLPCSPGDLPNPGIEPKSLALQADSLPSEPPWKPNKQPYLDQNKIHEVCFYKLEYFSLVRVIDGYPKVTSLSRSEP